MGDVRHQGDNKMNNKLTEDVLNILSEEVYQLKSKIINAREKDNWGTYNNIIKAFINVTDSIEKIESDNKINKINKNGEIEIVEEIVSSILSRKTENDISLETIINMIKKEFKIKDCNRLLDYQVYGILNIFEMSLLNLLKYKTNSDLSYCNLGKFKYSINKDDNSIDFINYDSMKFPVEHENSLPRINKYFRTGFCVELKNNEINIGISLKDILTKKENLLIYLNKIVDSYLDDIKAQETEIQKNKKNKFYIGIGMFTVKEKKYENSNEKYLNIELKMGIKAKEIK